MKNLFTKIVILSLGVTLLASCSDYLERGSKVKFTDDNYWTSESNVKTFAWGFYDRFLGYGNATSTNGDFYCTTFSDDQALHSGINIFPTAAPASSTDWNNAYIYIRKANLLLERVDKVPMADEAKNHYKGIARFFRAFEYANLIKRFGDVPYIDKFLDQSQTDLIYTPRTARNTVVDNIIADLQFAAQNIRTKAAAEANTVNRDVANAFLSRVALYEGSIAKYHNNDLTRANALFTIAKNAANAVMSQNYKLSTNYKDIYTSISLAANTEVILYKYYVKGTFMHCLTAYLNSTTPISGPTKDLVESYLCKDGKPIGTSTQYQGDVDINNVLANRDTRLADMIGNVLAYKGNPVGGLISSTGYLVKKFNNPSITGNDLTQINMNYTNAPIFWLAEVYLNYAEAAAELGTITQADVDNTINKLRARGGVASFNIANIPSDPKKDASVSALLWEIRRERRIELALDGFRTWDLRRWKKLSYLDPAVKPDIFKGAKVPAQTTGLLVDANMYIVPYSNISLRIVTEPKHYLDPIPTGVKNLYDLQGVDFPQNPGW
ncbi:MAG TPA: RagB/SusD family nutrient uptake outer membrane protein [Rikenellaceae bacterium]|nr:RagB/SusD family nutrient uptake outer membrane protein [Rikenellaceae bacterium]